jgi:hypothetical protein
MLEERQYQLLKEESERTGASIGELIRRAVDEKYGEELRRLRFRDALDATFGLWADRDFTGAEYVERIRQPMSERLKELGWD